MKKIIDANFFRDRVLLDYLQSSKWNMVVFPDCACMEAYKGNAIENISRSIEIVSKFPDQVIILKGVRDVVKLTLSDNRPDLLEDTVQTMEFRIFCQNVERAVRGDVALAEEILKKSQIASDHFNIMREDAMRVAEGIKEFTKSFTPEHLKVLRNRKELKPEIIEKILKEILLLAAFLFQDHPDVSEIPQARKVRNSYIFRFAISAYLLTLRWITYGGIENFSLDKLRNDMVDMNYVTYATFFDGLLTKENKMIEIYQEASFLLKRVFT